MADNTKITAAYFTSQGKKYEIGLTATGSVDDATDKVAGKVTLSDALNDSSNAASGKKAATPAAVKQVNDKLGDLSSLTTNHKDTLVGAINEVKATAGSGGGGSGSPDAALTTVENIFKEKQTFNKNIALANTAGVTKQSTTFSKDTGGTEATNLITTLQNKEGKSVSRLLLSVGDATNNKQRYAKLELLKDDASSLGSLILESKDGSKVTLIGPETDAGASGSEIATAKFVKDRIAEISTGGDGKPVADATDSVKGVVKLSDATDGTEAAANGATAATPKAVADVKKISDQAYKVANAVGSKVGDLNNLQTQAKDTIVNAINEIKASAGTGGEVANATDKVAGTVKLSDAIDNSDLAAESGITAATPKAVAAVNKKLQDYIDQGGGGSGGNTNYIIKPKIISPANTSMGITTQPTIVGTTYMNAFDQDIRKVRTFQIAKTDSFDSPVLNKEVNADSYTLSVEEQLEANTQYFIRIKDTSTSGIVSEWSSTIKFTTTDSTIYIAAPTLTLVGYQGSDSDFVSGLTINGSKFTMVGEGKDTHESTTWKIIPGAGGDPVWKSENDTKNLTSIVVPEGTLQNSTKYNVIVTYKGKAYPSSAPGSKQFTTAADFGTIADPTVSVSGYPDTVSKTPVLTMSAFSNTRDKDTHDKSDWSISLKEKSGEPVWQSLDNTINLTAISVPAEKLQEGKTYVVTARQHGAKLGWSNYATKEFTVATIAESTILTPTHLSYTGEATGAAVKLMYLAAGPFVVNSGEYDDHDMSDWYIYKASDTQQETPVWRSTSSNVNKKTAYVPMGTLEPNTEYVFKVRFHGKTYGWSNFASKAFKTVEAWNEDPDNGISPNVATEGFAFTAAAPGTNVNFFQISGQWLPDAVNFTVFKNGERDSSSTIYNLNFAANDKIYIKSNGTKFPVIKFANMSSFGNDLSPSSSNVTVYKTNSYAGMIKSIDAPLPTMYYKEGVPNFEGAYIFLGQYNLESLPDAVFWNNPGIETFVGLFSEATLLHSVGNYASDGYMPRPDDNYILGSQGAWNSSPFSTNQEVTATNKLTKLTAKLFAYSTCVIFMPSVFHGMRKLETIEAGIFDYMPALSVIDGVNGNLYYCNTPSANSDPYYRGCSFYVESALATSPTAGTRADSIAYKAAASSTSYKALFNEYYTPYNTTASMRSPYTQTSVLSSYPNSGGYNIARADAYYNPGLFSDCRTLSAIPDNLFAKCPSIVSAVNTFANCTTLLKTAKNLFGYKPLMHSIMSIYAFCKSLTTVCSYAFNQETDTSKATGANWNWDTLSTSSSSSQYHTKVSQLFLYCPALVTVEQKALNNLHFTYAWALFGSGNKGSYANEYETNLTTISDDLFNCGSFYNLSSPINCVNVANKTAGTLPKVFTDLNDTRSISYPYLYTSWASTVTEIPTGTFRNLPKLLEITSAFSNFSKLTTINELIVENCELLTSCPSMFSNCAELANTGKNLFNNVPSLKTLSSMFSGCPKLTTIQEDLFIHCDNVSTLDNAFCYNTSSVNSTDYAGLTIPAGLFQRTPNLTSCTYIFSGNKLAAPVPDNLFKGLTKLGDTSVNSSAKTTYIFSYTSGHSKCPSRLFSGCEKVKDVTCLFYNSDLSSISLTLFEGNSSITNLITAFEYTRITTLPAGAFDTLVNLVDIDTAFAGTSLTTIEKDVFKLNVALQDVSDAFANCSNLTTVHVDLFKYNTNITNVSQTFKGCSKLTPAIRIGSSKVSNANSFAYQCAGTGMVYVPKGSTTYSTFSSATNPNVNVTQEEAA